MKSDSKFGMMKKYGWAVGAKGLIVQYQK